MTKSLFVASALALCLPAAAFAQTTPPPAPDGAMQQRGPGRGMMRADINGDGMISKAEAAAQSAERFAAMDTNKDGVLTADELTGPGARGMLRADADGDGKVMRAEYDAMAQQRLARMDGNGDGMISADEIQGLINHARGSRGPGRADPADAVGPAPRPSPIPSQ